MKQPIDRVIVESSEVWVCPDCYMAHHYGTGNSADWCAEQWNSDDYLRGVMSIDAELTDWTCSGHEGTDDDECQWCGETGYDGGIDTFSKSPCELCGSDLAGSRYRLGMCES